MQPRPDKEAKDFKRGSISGVIMRDLKKQVGERGWLAELFRRDEDDPHTIYRLD